MASISRSLSPAIRHKRQGLNSTIFPYTLSEEGSNGMHLANLSSRKKAGQVGQDQPGFNWIRVLVVPVIAGIMEAQPVVIVSELVALIFSGRSEDLLLAEVSTLLLIWCLYWWELLARQVIQPRAGEQWARALYFLAWPVSFVLIMITYPLFFLTTVFALCMSLYLWRRGVWRVENDLRGESAMPAFRVGFVVMFMALLFAVVDPQPGARLLLALFPFVLLLFCLSGLVALSFTHLDELRTAHAHRFSGNIRTSPTRTGIQTSLGLLAALATLMLVFVATAFQPLAWLFSPLINSLRTLIAWLSGFLKFLLSAPPVPNCLYQVCLPPPGPSYYFSQYNPSSSLRTGGLSLLAFFVFIVLAWFVWRALRGRKSNQNDDETRERLPVRKLLKARRNSRRRPKSELESLSPTSARAHYRAFLQAMARRGNEEQSRRPEETPAEYQARLLASARTVVQQDEMPTDAAILDTLTRAYTRERYGGKPPTTSQQSYLRRWVSLLVRRLAGRQ